RQKDDVVGVLADTRNLGVRDVFNRIRAAGVFGDRNVFVVDLAIFLVVDDVFENRAEAERIVNVGLGFAREVDDFGVAPAFDVEDALVAPTVFVVTDEAALGIGRQGGLAGARQAEKNRGRAARHVLGGRAVHGHDFPLGHEVVHEGEHALFHLAGIAG